MALKDSNVNTNWANPSPVKSKKKEEKKRKSSINVFVDKTDQQIQVDEDDIPENNEVTEADLEAEYQSRAYWRDAAETRQLQLQQRLEEESILKEEIEWLHEGMENAEKLAVEVQAALGDDDDITNKLINAIKDLENYKKAPEKNEAHNKAALKEPKFTTKKTDLYEDNRSVGIQVEIVTSTDLTSDNPSRVYWKQLAETRLKSLLQIIKRITRLKKEKNLLNEVLHHASDLASFIQEAVEQPSSAEVSEVTTEVTTTITTISSELLIDA